MDMDILYMHERARNYEKELRMSVMLWSKTIIVALATEWTYKE